MKKTYDRKKLKEAQKEWIEVPMEAIPEKFAENYCKRKLAIDLFIKGIKIIEIENKCFSIKYGINI